MGLRESEHTLDHILHSWERDSLNRFFKARAKLGQMNHNSGEGPENESLGFVD